MNSFNANMYFQQQQQSDPDLLNESYNRLAINDNGDTFDDDNNDGSSSLSWQVQTKRKKYGGRPRAEQPESTTTTTTGGGESDAGGGLLPTPNIAPLIATAATTDSSPPHHHHQQQQQTLIDSTGSSKPVAARWATLNATAERQQHGSLPTSSPLPAATSCSSTTNTISPSTSHHTTSRDRHENVVVDGITVGSDHHPLEHAYTFWYFKKERVLDPAAAQSIDYESNMKEIGDFASVESFWTLYSHLKRPSEMPAPSDYQMFRKGVKPIWEDPENKLGGKWLIRVKKEYTDRLWEDLLLAIVGNQFEASGYGEVCGAVISIREFHDVISLWIKSTNKITRDRVKDSLRYVLKLPGRTIMEWRVHDASLNVKPYVSGASSNNLNSPLSAGGSLMSTWPTSPSSPTGGEYSGTPGTRPSSDSIFGKPLSYDQQQ